jgi:hypothetical protein
MATGVIFVVVVKDEAGQSILRVTLALAVERLL